MADVVYSHSGVTIAVSLEPQNEILDEEGFQSLTYIDIGNVGMLGEYGVKTTLLTYDFVDTNITVKAKGLTNAGDPNLELARADDDPGQTLMRIFGHPDYDDHHAFRVTKQEGAVDFLRGLVIGPIIPNGRNEDFDLQVFTLGLVQLPIHVVALTGDWLLLSGFWSAGGIWTPDGIWPE